MLDRIDLAAIKAAAKGATTGPWVMGRSHAETKDAMIAYVINCIEVSPLLDRFYMVGTKDWAADVCHTGNGPTSEANGHFLALCNPATLLALVAAVEALMRAGHEEACAITEWKFHLPYSEKKGQPACTCALAPFASRPEAPHG